MIDSTNFIISLINLISIILGGISIGLIYNLIRKSNSTYLNYFFFFVVLSSISGFCDWIIFNWVILLVPNIKSSTSDLIYHIFWNIIGFPASLFALFCLFKALNNILNLKLSYRINNFIIFLLLFISILSYVSFYFRLQETNNISRNIVNSIHTYIIPIINLSYLVFAFLKSYKVGSNNQSVKTLIILLFISFSLWYFLSVVPINFREWHHIIIFSYYLIIFIPSVFLFVKHKSFNIVSVNKPNANIDVVFEFNNFTERERDLVLLLIEGKSNKEISEELYISLQTVKNYVSKIYKKIGINNRVQLVNFARKYIDNK